MRRFFFLLSVILTSQLCAQDPVRWSGSVKEKQVSAGSTVMVMVYARIGNTWHIYSLTQPEGGPIPTSISVSEGSFFSPAGKPKQPDPTISFDESFGINTEYFSGDVIFVVPVRIAANTPLGNQKIILKARYMVCNNTVCLPPVTKIIEVPVTVIKAKYSSKESMTGAVASQLPELRQSNGTPDSSRFIPDAVQPKIYSIDPADIVAQAKAKGLWNYITLAMSLGALSLLTPCVFPMIPITVSYFTKRREGKRNKGIADALVYSLGIIFTFTALGFALALTIGASGLNQFAANPWVNLAIAGIFIAFAVNLFGAFEIILPSSLLTKLSKYSNTNSMAGVLLMGLTFTITSFTCTVPFVGTVMVTAAQGEWMWPIIGMLAFSVTFALPFFLLALFPSFLVRLPKSGGWLNAVKVVMGFLELAAALKFLSNVDLVLQLGVLNREVFLSLWIAIAIMTVLYLMGRFSFSHDAPVEKIGVVRMLWSVFFLAAVFFLFTGLIGAPLGELDAFLPPRSYSNIAGWIGKLNGSGTVVEEEQWISNYQDGLKRAKTEGKNIFVDFTGFACTNCRWMEANIFPRDDVKAQMKKFILVRLYTDGNGSEYDRNRLFEQNRFGTIALPFYVILSPDDREVARFPGLTRNPEEFVQFLKQGAAVRK
ncbi:MAG: cytochrome c biogenesis protein CcdA [Bacteroidota bacterium]